MHDAVETETHETQRADDDAIELVETAILSQKSMSRFMKADESPVHQVADHEHERHGQPDPSGVHREASIDFSENANQKREVEKRPA